MAFTDLDVVCISPIAQEVSYVFDRYWNSEFAVPVSAIIKEQLTEQEFQKKKEKNH